MRSGENPRKGIMVVTQIGSSDPASQSPPGVGREGEECGRRRQGLLLSVERLLPLYTLGFPLRFL